MRNEEGYQALPSSSKKLDDSQGKFRASDTHKRMALLLLAFTIGITFGVVIAQRFYVEANRPEGSLQQLLLPSNAQPTQKATLSEKLASGHVVSSAGIGAAAVHRPGCMAVQGDCELEAFLKRVAPTGEVLVAISNYNLIAWGNMLTTWIERVQKAGVPNFMVLAIDELLHTYLDNLGVPNYYMKAEIAAAQQGTGSNHAVSALKFGLLAEFLKLGWSVLLSDVDVVTLSNPFQHLYRDRDIEGMTDGFDDPTAYGLVDGLDDPSMGWARYAQSTKHMNLNSGLFYVRANGRTVALMAKLAERLSKQKYWDQTAFNEEIFFLSHGATTYVPISVRVMDYWLFQNSKVFFKKWRHMPEATRPKPVMVHINYHPDKGQRMNGIIEYFDSGKTEAIMKWPGGSEPGSR